MVDETRTTELLASKHHDSRSTEELIRFALLDRDSHEPWDAISTLHFRGNREVLEAAQGLCVSDDARERQFGADILGQLGVSEKVFVEEKLAALTRLLDTDSDPDVLAAACIALGHLYNPRVVLPVARLKAHPSSDVTYGVASGLLAQDDPIAIATLVELSQDVDENVRDWATFGLGSMIETDTPEIREALLRRLDDPHDDTRGEALVGLARRKDERVLSHLIKGLNEAGADAGLMLFDAVGELDDARLCPVLLRLKALGVERTYLEEAIGKYKCEER